VNARRAIFGLLTAVSVFAAAAWQHIGPTPQGTRPAVAEPGEASDALQDVWSKPQPFPNLLSVSLSPNGAFFATVAGGKHQITIYHQNGRLIWTKPAPTVSSAIVSNDGETVIAFAPLDPTRTAIRIYRGQHGDAEYDSTLDGAVWDVDISSDSKTATVVTGGHSLYLFHLDDALKHDRWSLPGAGNSVAISRNDQYVVAGTWDTSGISVYDKTGKLQWPFPEKAADQASVANRLFEAQIAHDAPVMLGISYANFHHSSPKVYFWSLRHPVNPLWTRDLGPDASYPKALIAANGQYVALSYLTSVSHGDQTLEERHLMVLDRFGDQVFYLPGFMFSPNLVATSADGATIVISDGHKSLYTVSINDRMSAPLVFASPIRQTVASQDGHYVLVYTIDGRMSLMRLA
jgi:hypothetical protein